MSPTSLYRGQESLVRQERWVDPASSSIPFAYFLTSAALAEVLDRKGRTAEATRMFTTARAIARVAGFEGLLEPAGPRGDSPRS